MTKILCKCGHTMQEHEAIWGDEIIMSECSYDDPVCNCKAYTPQNENKAIRKPDKENWEGVVLNLQEGDVLTSKKGFLSESPITKEYFVYKKVKYNGKGCFTIMGNKRTIEIKKTTGDKKNDKKI